MANGLPEWKMNKSAFILLCLCCLGEATWLCGKSINSNPSSAISFGCVTLDKFLNLSEPSFFQPVAPTGLWRLEMSEKHEECAQQVVTVINTGDNRNKAFSAPPPESHSQPWIRNDLPGLWLPKPLLPLPYFVTFLRSLSWLLNCSFVAPAFPPPPRSSLLAGGTAAPTSLGTSQAVVEALVCGRPSTDACFVLCHCLKIEAYNLRVFSLYSLWYLELFILW